MRRYRKNYFLFRADPATYRIYDFTFVLILKTWETSSKDTLAKLQKFPIPPWSTLKQQKFRINLSLYSTWHWSKTQVSGYTYKFGFNTRNVKNCWLGVKLLNLSNYIPHKSFDPILSHRTAKLRWWQGKKPFVHYIVMPHHIKYWHL